MMTNHKFERESAFRSRVAILVALVVHLLLLGAVFYQSDSNKVKKIDSTKKEKPTQPQP